jgi:alkanesulfonate monooxygenase SsuD/methylene tetrahydromethanopterin reductase-like flavin-dependent oxidoreductase (luciferase family)
MFWTSDADTSNSMATSTVGTPEKIRERLKQYTDAGVDQFLLAFQDPLDIKALELKRKGTLSGEDQTAAAK